MSEPDDREVSWVFFVSYTRADAAWARWIAWALKEAGYRVLLQEWDFVPGSNWIQLINTGVQDAAHTVAVMSAEYLESAYCQAEWQAAWQLDPDGAGRRLLPVRVKDCERPGLLAGVVGVDLFGISEPTARARLRTMAQAATTGQIGPPEVPAFPDSVAAPQSEPRFPGARPRVWNVPPRNPHFTGRVRELRDLSRGLAAGSAMTVQAVHGMGGVGKTQLATEYAHAHARDYDLVWWTVAEQPLTLKNQFAALATRLGLDPAADPAVLYEQVQDRLQKVDGWLLIFDNARSAADIRPWLPSVPMPAGVSGHVITTTQRGGFGALGQVLDLDVISLPDAVALLRGRVRRLGQGVSRQIAAELGRLPLALEQAAAYIDQTRMTGEEYLNLLREHAREVYRRGVVSGHSATIATLWDMSLGTISGTDPAAVQLLELCAYLAPEPVPLEMFTGHTGLLPGPLAAAAASQLDFEDTVAVLFDYSLAQRSPAGLQLHRLIQAAIRGRLSETAGRQARLRAETILAASNPGDPGNPGTWPRWALLIPHLLAAGLAATADPALRTTACDACRYLLARGDARGARDLASRLHASWQARLGEDDQHTLLIADHLASALGDLGDNAAARDLAARALDRRRVQGEDLPDTLTSASNLAKYLRALGELQAARELHDDTLTRRRRKLGDDHPDTLSSASNLAFDLAELGDLPAARDLDEQVLADRRRKLGDDHPDTLSSASNLAADLAGLGGPDNLKAARVLTQDVLDRRRRVLGRDHHDTLTSASNLANILGEPGELADLPTSRALAEDVLDRRRRVLGEDHPDTLASAVNLADTCSHLGDLPAAIGLAEPTLTRSRRVLGDNHPVTLACASNLARYRLASRDADREPPGR